MPPPSEPDDRAPTRKELAAARIRLERRLQEVSTSGRLTAAERDRENAALRTAIAIVDRLLSPRAGASGGDRKTKTAPARPKPASPPPTRSRRR